MSNKVKKIILVTVFSATVGCSGGFRDVVGLKSRAPDEFRVVSNAPLVVPPEFNLRPPAPGAKRLQDVDLQQQAKDILFEAPLQKNSVTESKGESLFLKKAAIDDSDSQIKDVLAKEEQDVAAVKQKGFFEKIVSYAKNDKSKEPVSAGKEQVQQEENEKKSGPASESGVAVIGESKDGVLNNIFGF